MQSAETLAHVALIARHGPKWFRSAGLPDAPGTCLVTVSGPVANPGVCEVEFGTPITAILERAEVNAPIGAVVVGGYGGTWLRAGLLDTPYAPGPLRTVGSAVGAGVLAAIATSACGVAETARVATYMAYESAGQCGPCVFGLQAVAHDLVELARGENDPQTLDRLNVRLAAMEGRGACGHPDGVVRFVRSALAGVRRRCRRSRPASTLSRMEPSARPARHRVRRRRRRADGADRGEFMPIAASSYRLRVNPVACDAFGYCAELVPELVLRDEWGYPVLVAGAIPPRLFELARRAVRECPRRALFIERTS